MNEHEHGSSPEHISSPEQNRLSTERIALTTRLLLGPETLHPAKTDLPQIEKEHLTHLSESVTKIKQTSQTERESFWNGKENNNFENQKRAWAEQVKTSLVTKISGMDEAEKASWTSVYEKVGIPGDVTTEKLLHVYETFFTGENCESNLDKFVTVIADSYRTADGINYAALQADMEKIAWFANIFGGDTSKIIPSLIEAKLASEDETVKEELIQKANAKENDILRVNRPTGAEEMLLRGIALEGLPPLHAESEPIERKPAIIISHEQIEQIKNKKTKLTEDSEELSYAEIAEKLFDVKTGLSKGELVDLVREYPRFMQELTTAGLEQVRQGLIDHKGTLVLSPTAWSMLDAIATRSREINKELGFTLQGVSHTADRGKEILVASHIVPAHDYTLAQKDVADMRDIQFFATNANAFAQHLNLAEHFRSEGQAKQIEHYPTSGEALFTIHTHQEQLGEDYIATPSPEDEEDVQRILTTSNIQDYNWGILSKTADGSLHFAVFSSHKDEAGQIHHQRIAILSPDLSTVHTIPDNGYGEKLPTPNTLPAVPRIQELPAGSLRSEIDIGRPTSARETPNAVSDLLFNVDTGRATGERFDLLPEFSRLIEDTREAVQRSPEKFSENTTVLSNLAQAQINKITELSNQRNVELGFVIAGEEMILNGKRVTVGTFVVPLMDYQNAQDGITTPDIDFMAQQLGQLTENTNLKEYFQRKKNSELADMLGQFHTHQEQGQQEELAKPSREDYQTIEEHLQTADVPQGFISRWGVFTKTRNTLYTQSFAATKDAQSTITHKPVLLLPEDALYQNATLPLAA